MLGTKLNYVWYITTTSDVFFFVDDERAIGSVLTFGNHEQFLSRIKKTLYYGKLPSTERLSLPVSELATELFSEVKNGYSLDYLDLKDAATLTRNACVSPCSLVLALLYLERLKTCNPDYLHQVASSELFLISMMVASKFLHDDGEENEVFNDEWATSAGITVKHINNLERNFLNAIDWEVFVSEQAFWKQLWKVERIISLQEGKRRGWFTYTELDSLINSIDLCSLMQAFLTVSAVCLTSYAASILTLLGSVLIVSNIPGTCINSRTQVSTGGNVHLNSSDYDNIMNSDYDMSLDNVSPNISGTFSLDYLASPEYSSITLQHSPFDTVTSVNDCTQKNNQPNDLWTQPVLKFVKRFMGHVWKYKDQNSDVCNNTKHHLNVINNSTYQSAFKNIYCMESKLTEYEKNIPHFLKWLFIVLSQRSSQTTFLPLEVVAF